MKRSLSVRIIATILIGQMLSGVGWGATYFVSNAGSDAAAGTSTGAAWKTISKVNASTFAAGDSVSFAKDGIWYETLVMPSSGDAGGQITFTSYGTGAKPILSGAIDASVFPIGTPADLTLVALNGDLEHGDGTHWDWTSLGTGGAITADNTDKHAGTYSMKMVYGSAGNLRADLTVTLEANTYYNFSYWQKKTAGTDGNVIMKNNTDSTYLQADGSWTTNVAGVPTLTTTSADWTQFAIVFKSSTASAYLFRWQITAGSAAGSTSWVDDVSVKKVQWEQVSGNEYKANIHQNRLLSTTKSLYMNWDAAVTGAAYYNGTALTIGTPTSLAEGECGWDSTNKTYNIRLAGSPSGLDVKIPWRGMNIHLNGKDYITINGLDLRYTAADDGTNVTGGIVAEDSASTNITIQNTDFSRHWSSGVKADTGAHTTWTVTQNTFDKIWNGRAYGSNGAGTGIYGNTGQTTFVATRNQVTNAYAAIRAEAPGGLFSENIVSGAFVNGIDHQTNSAATPVLIYGNSIYHTPQWAGGHGIAAQVDGDGAKIKNNAVWTYVKTGATGEALCLSDSYGIEVDNNLLYATGDGTKNIARLKAATATPALADTTYATLALLKTALADAKYKSDAAVAWTSNGTLGTSGMAAGVTGDPLWNASFILQPSSPAKDTGIDLCSALTTVVDYWGYSVCTAGSFSGYGAAPDIGANEFHFGAPSGGGWPTGGRMMLMGVGR